MSEDIDIGKISEALNDKTDRDFNNMNPSSLSKETVVCWGIPDYSAGVTYSSEFVAPSNGYCLAANHTAAWGTPVLLADGKVIDRQHNNSNTGNILVYTRGFVKKGQIITKDGVSDWNNVIFYPCLGG